MIKIQKLKDQDIRLVLQDYLPTFFYEETIVYSEMQLNGYNRYRRYCIADLLAFNEKEIIGFEIKSDHDTFARFQKQKPLYELFCSYCYLVVGSSHIQEAKNILPSHWGILEVYDGGDSMQVELIREASLNPHLDKSFWLEFLWRDELIYLLRKFNLYKGLSRARMTKLQRVLVEQASPDVLLKEIVFLLKQRDRQRFC